MSADPWSTRPPAWKTTVRASSSSISVTLRPLGFRAPDEVVFDMRQQLADCEGYSDSRGLFSARKAIMQYSQLRNIPNVDMKHIYTGNGVSELIQLSMHALIENGDEVLVPAPDYPLWTACVTLAGGNAVHYICDEQNEWNPDLEDMERRSPSAPRPSSSSTLTILRALSIHERFWRASSRSPVSISS